MIACAALGSLAWLVGASVAVADDAPARILSYSDMVKLTQQTEDQLEAAKAATWKYKDINVALAEGFFQAPDLLAYGRLGNLVDLGGLGEAFRLGEVAEDFEALDLHK